MDRTTKAPLFLVTCAALACYPSCRPHEVPQESVTQRIDGAGGAIDVASPGGGAARLEIAPGGPVLQISGRVSDRGIAGMSNVYEFQPEGTVFTVPAKLAIRLSRTEAVDLTSAYLVTRHKGGIWERLPNSSVDLNTRTVSAPVAHFSEYAVVSDASSVSAVASRFQIREVSIVFSADVQASILALPGYVDLTISRAPEAVDVHLSGLDPAVEQQLLYTNSYRQPPTSIRVDGGSMHFTTTQVAPYRLMIQPTHGTTHVSSEAECSAIDGGIPITNGCRLTKSIADNFEVGSIFAPFYGIRCDDGVTIGNPEFSWVIPQGPPGVTLAGIGAWIENCRVTHFSIGINVPAFFNLSGGHASGVTTDLTSIGLYSTASGFSVQPFNGKRSSFQIYGVLSQESVLFAPVTQQANQVVINHVDTNGVIKIGGIINNSSVSNSSAAAVVLDMPPFVEGASVNLAITGSTLAGSPSSHSVYVSTVKSLESLSIDNNSMTHMTWVEALAGGDQWFFRGNTVSGSGRVDLRNTRSLTFSDNSITSDNSWCATIDGQPEVTTQATIERNRFIGCHTGLAAARTLGTIRYNHFTSLQLGINLEDNSAPTIVLNDFLACRMAVSSQQPLDLGRSGAGNSYGHYGTSPLHCNSCPLGIYTTLFQNQSTHRYAVPPGYTALHYTPPALFIPGVDGTSNVTDSHPFGVTLNGGSCGLSLADYEAGGAPGCQLLDLDHDGQRNVDGDCDDGNAFCRSNNCTDFGDDDGIPSCIDCDERDGSCGLACRGFDLEPPSKNRHLFEPLGRLP